MSAIELGNSLVNSDTDSLFDLPLERFEAEEPEALKLPTQTDVSFDRFQPYSGTVMSLKWLRLVPFAGRALGSSRQVMRFKRSRAS